MCHSQILTICNAREHNDHAERQIKCYDRGYLLHGCRVTLKIEVVHVKCQEAYVADTLTSTKHVSQPKSCQLLPVSGYVMKLFCTICVYCPIHCTGKFMSHTHMGILYEYTCMIVHYYTVYYMYSWPQKLKEQLTVLTCIHVCVASYYHRLDNDL